MRQPFQPGDKILFRRNDVWRGQLIPHGGSQAGQVIYAAYGPGAKPLLLGSVSKSRPADWTEEGKGIWSAGGFAADVGNIIFDDGKACGVKRWHESDLQRDGDFWYDAGAPPCVKLRSAENPAKRHAPIECAIREHVILQLNRGYIIYADLAREVRRRPRAGRLQRGPHHRARLRFLLPRRRRSIGRRTARKIRQRDRVLGRGARQSGGAVPPMGDLRCGPDEPEQRPGTRRRTTSRTATT